MTDLINRQEAIDILLLGAEILRRVLDDMDVVGIDREKYSYGLKLLESDIEDIKELPSVQPERKTGRWIYGESEVGNDGYYCSECGNFVPWIYEESAMNFIREYKFCPNCGAKMEGEKKE